jgi:PadR family transcriptional regulator PadR
VESKSGPPRKYYQLTKDGELFMAELSKTWNELGNAVDHIINKTINQL